MSGMLRSLTVGESHGENRVVVVEASGRIHWNYDSHLATLKT